MALWEDKAYAAGFFDGEGSVNVAYRYTKHSTWHHWLDITVGQKHPRVLEWLCDVWGGSIHKTGSKGYQGYVWSISTREAARFVSDILPFAREKEQQLILASEFSGLMHPQPGGPPLSDDEVAVRHAYKEAIMQANRGAKIIECLEVLSDGQ